jgi:hypothetical protein
MPTQQGAKLLHIDFFRYRLVDATNAVTKERGVVFRTGLFLPGTDGQDDPPLLQELIQLRFENVADFFDFMQRRCVLVHLQLSFS